MQVLKNKLRGARGETIVEALASVLIVTLSCIIFFTMTMSSSRINTAAIAADDAFYTHLTAAEVHAGGTPVSVTVRWSGGSEVFSAVISGGDGELTSYRGGGAP